MDRLQSALLDLLAETTTPIGSGALLGAVRERGLAVSQPTLGRALRVLDERSLTTKVSNKGRLITAEGRRWLAEARRREDGSRWTGQTLMAVGHSTLGELRESMIARRAVEREIARLAAERATPADISELRRIVESQGRDIGVGGRGAEEALDFHVVLARVCGNRFLAAAVSLVRSGSRVLENLMYHLGATVGSSFDSHRALVEAIASRDPRSAEDAMVRHLNELIQDVDELFERLSQHPAVRGAPPAIQATGDGEIQARNDGRTGRPDGLDGGW